MSYVVSETTGAARRRRWPWVVAAVVVLLLVATTAFWLGRSNSQPAARPTSPAPSPSEQQGPWGPLQWRPVADSPLPFSAEHGPRTVTDGLARGFSHDKAGAVLAALHISTRASSAAGPRTYRAVVREQTYGDKQAQLSQLSRQSSSASAAATRPQQWWYAITGGDPRGDLVQVSLVASSEQSRQMGGYAHLTRTLSWRNGDWRLQVPTPAPELRTSTAGHTRIGGP
ncbi:hypothetical protein FHX42_005199 [Saccharopolyspora lacisalsi]|uniref:DUF8175 domain-containing protein n=1 Tax=Halosaccharopolyspora lacisalsi TaxID=1000566 RepID=A0A839E0R4_9PSEU|nr:hypothetical protein [Halosaccharopolyspora lacisalsi]MBA8827792.1 hypothetical protein [Halosaccharopolyspora lacisalsi]